MDKKLFTNIEFIKSNIKKEKTSNLLKYCSLTLIGFQHERLIHLLVTLGFALFSIIFFIFTIILCIIPTPPTLLVYCSSAVTLILIITLTFYLRHYYLLENGVQKLEELQTELALNANRLKI